MAPELAGIAVPANVVGRGRPREREFSTKFIAKLFDRSFDPARARRLPIRSEAGESNVRGLYLVGEIAGTPLIKLGLNRGRDVIDHIAGGFESTRDGQLLDVLIVGAGSSGLGAADRCQELGLRYLVIEQQRVAQLIRDFTRGKPLYMEPPNEENRTRLFCRECPKEQLIEAWDRQVVELGLAPQIHEFETVGEIQRLADRAGFRVTTDKGDYRTRRVVLAIGMGGNPRHLKVPGELDHAARISQNVADPDAYRDRDLVVFGAGDVACEAAIALAERGNRITMVAPDRELTFPRKRNIDGVMAAVAAGTIDLHLGHAAAGIGSSSVTICNLDTGATFDAAADHVFRCIGADPPLKFLDGVGIRLEARGTWAAGCCCWRHSS